jgi:toxin CcdB
VVSGTHRQFDVFANPDRETAKAHPYLVVLQSDAVSRIDTCIVAPLAPPRTIKLFERLLPQVAVDGVLYTIAVPDMAAIPTSEIGAPIANLESERYRIIAALDLVFTGI